VTIFSETFAMPTQAELLATLKGLTPRQSRFAKLRAGSFGDGGYVLPNDLDGIDKVLSIGIGNEISFDRFFAERGATLYQYDHTITALPEHHANFIFHPVAWGVNDDGQSRSLATMIATHGFDRSNSGLLKFDVEGAEWSCLTNVTPEQLKPFRIISCELHALNNLQNDPFLHNFRRIMALLTHHHTCVHLHANNCCGMSLIEGIPIPNVLEITLLRNDRSEFSPSHEPIPGPLDYPSMSDRADLILTPFH
jgi:hypothetical protein